MPFKIQNHLQNQSMASVENLVKEEDREEEREEDSSYNSDFKLPADFHI